MTKHQNAGGLEKGVNSKDALKWINLATVPVVLNGQQVDIGKPDGANYFLLEYVKPVEGGDRYNAVFNQGSEEIATRNGYSTFGAGEQRVQPNRWYKLPDYVRQIHLGQKRHT